MTVHHENPDQPPIYDLALDHLYGNNAGVTAYGARPHAIRDRLYSAVASFIGTDEYSDEIKHSCIKMLERSMSVAQDTPENNRKKDTKILDVPELILHMRETYNQLDREGEDGDAVAYKYIKARMEYATENKVDIERTLKKYLAVCSQDEGKYSHFIGSYAIAQDTLERKTDHRVGARIFEELCQDIPVPYMENSKGEKLVLKNIDHALHVFDAIRNELSQGYVFHGRMQDTVLDANEDKDYVPGTAVGIFAKNIKLFAEKFEGTTKEDFLFNKANKASRIYLGEKFVPPSSRFEVAFLPEQMQAAGKIKDAMQKIIKPEQIILNSMYKKLYDYYKLEERALNTNDSEKSIKALTTSKDVPNHELISIELANNRIDDRITKDIISYINKQPADNEFARSIVDHAFELLVGSNKKRGNDEVDSTINAAASLTIYKDIIEQFKNATDFRPQSRSLKK